MNFPRLSTFKPFFTVHKKYIHINLDLVSSQFSFLTFSQKIFKISFSGLVCYRTVTDNEFSPSVCRPKDVVSKWTNEFLDCWNDPKCVLPL